MVHTNESCMTVTEAACFSDGCPRHTGWWGMHVAFKGREVQGTRWEDFGGEKLTFKVSASLKAQQSPCLTALF